MVTQTSSADHSRLLAETETWFERRGLPHFVEGYRASDDVYTRIAPLLALVFVAEMLGAANLEWAWWQNVLALLGGVGILLVAWIAVNRLRRRAALALPDSVGLWELAIFVVVPAVLPVVFGGQWLSALVTLLANIAVVVVASFVVSYHLLSVSRWALELTGHQLAQVVDLFARALPLLLLFTVALFINAEVWQVGASLDGFLFAASLAFFVVLAVMFLLIRLPRELAVLRRQLDAEATIGACRQSPLAPVAEQVVDDAADAGVDPAAMSRRQEGNVLVVLLVSQGVQVLIVATSILVFFVLFGVIAIRPDVASTWTGTDVADSALVRWTWFDQQLAVTPALLRVATFLGALSGFYFTVYVITDSTYRDEFFEDVVHDVRESIAVRNVYLALRRRAGRSVG